MLPVLVLLLLVLLRLLLTLSRAPPRPFRANLTLKNPKLWWPNGYGKQSRYRLDLALVLRSGHGGVGGGARVDSTRCLPPTLPCLRS